MCELPAAVNGRAWGACGSDGGPCGAGAGVHSGDVLDSLSDLLGGPEDTNSADSGQGQMEAAAEEDPLALLAAGDFFAEPSGGSLGCAAAARAGATAGCHTGGAPAVQPDMKRLAGAVAAAGVLLPVQQLQGGSPASSCRGGSAAASASSGHASGGEGPATAGHASGVPAAAGAGSHGRQLAAALQRQCSLAGCQDLGCIAAVTLRWMHNPEWLVEGARLLVRDRTTGRTSGAGYVTAARPAAT